MTWPEGEEQQNRFIVGMYSHQNRKSCTASPLMKFITEVPSPKGQNAKPFSSQLRASRSRCSCLLSASIISAAGGQQPKSKQKVERQQRLQSAGLRDRQQHHSQHQSKPCAGTKATRADCRASPGTPQNQGKGIWLFTWHPWRGGRTGGRCRGLRGKGTEKQSRQKGFVSHKGPLLCSVCLHSPSMLTNNSICMFVVSGCLKRSTGSRLCGNVTL